VNHSWHATLYLGARGLTTGPVTDGGKIVEIQLDLVEHRVIGNGSDGRSASLPLESMSVAEFHRRFVELLTKLGADSRMSGRPSEMADAVPFVQDERSRPYDADAVERFFRALTLINPVFERFRTAFFGKSSPVHLYWGSFDLSLARFSGRPAPLHPGGLPGLPDEVMQEAESHENYAAGFWPGGGLSGVEYPAFYAYAYPAPEGVEDARVQPSDAFFFKDAGEFLLPYDAVRRTADPEAALFAFLQSTYEAAADLGGWDRAALDCPPGEPLRPRPLS
jgi:hypothetical protein